jgi:hypothetical protein
MILRLKDLVTLILWMLGALAAVIAGPMVIDWLLRSPAPSLWARLAAVAIAVLAFLPWLALVLWSVRRTDEFQRRIFTLGTALAFGGMLLYFAAFDAMVAAGFIRWDTPVLPLPAAIVLWVVGVAVASTYYRLRR